MTYSERSYYGEPCHHCGVWEDHMLTAWKLKRDAKVLERRL